MSLVTSRERDVRMPGSQIGFESDRQSCILHPFVKLKKMRMTFADADPDDFRRTLRWKRSDPLDGKKEGVELDRRQVCAQVVIDPFRHVGKETKRKMHLIACSPTHAANLRIKIDKRLLDRRRRANRNKQALRLHLPRLISAPDFGSFPLWLTGGGSERLNVLIARAIKFGNSAFAAMIRYAENGMTRTGLPRAQAVKILRAARSTEIDANGILRDQSNQRYSAA